jgi:hypothetical protein
LSTHLYLTSTASRDDVIEAFNEAFFQPPGFKDKLKPDWAGGQRKYYDWESASVKEAATAARVSRVKGALGAVQRKSGKSQVGVTIALDFGPSEGGTYAQIWLAADREFLGFSKEGGVLKTYAKEICKTLKRKGYGCDLTSRPAT